MVCLKEAHNDTTRFVETARHKGMVIFQKEESLAARVRLKEVCEVTEATLKQEHSAIAARHKASCDKIERQSGVARESAAATHL